MGLFNQIRKSSIVSAQMQEEDRRVSKLDWNGLKQHLVEVNQHYLEKEIYALVMLIHMKDEKLSKKLRTNFSNNKFGLELESILYRIFWLGFTVGCGLTNEQFANEKEELFNGKEKCRIEIERLLLSNGLNNKLLNQCFNATCLKMFEHGEVHGGGSEFKEFSPRRIYG